MNSSHIPRILALLLLAAFLLSIIPVVVIADQDNQSSTETSVTEEVEPSETDPVVPDEQVETESQQMGDEDIPPMSTDEPITETEVSDPESNTEPMEQDSGEPVETNNPEQDKFTGPDKDGLYTDPDGHKYYLLNNGTKGRVQIYKDSYGGIYFNSTVSGHGKHGNYPWMATAYLQQDSNGVLYSPGQWVYCIDFDGSAWGGETDTYDDLSQSPFWQNLSANQKLGIILALSYGAQNGSHNNYYANVATQTIIWEYQMGGRSTASTYSSNSASPISYASDGNGNYTYCKTQIDTEYTRILNEIKNAEYTPNFTESSYTLSDIGAANAHDFTDSEGALSKGVWKVYSAPAELNASIVNGKLRVYANSYYSGTKTITLKRDLYRPTSSAYVCVAGSQWAICGVPDDSSITITVSVEQPKTVRIKKTSSASASVLACIQGNPLYSLQGAVYEIHQGSANGPVVATLTTNANGEATTTQTFSVGTVLYAKEITAPPGYLLNSTAVPITVSTNDAQNVFNVSDTPLFDPEVFEVKKTGTDNRYISGAIFRAEFYASTRPTGTPQRTWYLESDAYGVVAFTDSHLATGYTSSALFKPSGTSVQFPLGCIKITEIKAAPGYITPSGDEGTAYIYIRQSGNDTTASWGDSQGNPTSNLGMYSITNDAVTATNEESGTMTMRKILPEDAPGGKEGYSFNVYRYAEDSSSGTLWYGRSDENGNIYKTNSNHAAVAENQRVYTFEDLEDGTYAFRELLSLREEQNIRTQRIRITTSGGSTAPVDLVFEGNDLIFEANGDCVIDGIVITGLNDGGTMSVEITNAPIVVPVEVVKISTDGVVADIQFEVEQFNSVNNSWTLKGTYTTGSDGKISIPGLSIGTRLRITEIVPENYVCTSDNPQEITVAETGNTVTFTNKPIGSLEIIKTSSNGVVSGITFTIEKRVNAGWQNFGSYVTDANGRINIDELDTGTQLRITETVPEGYVCLSENPQTVTIVKGTNTVNFENEFVELEILKTSPDGRVNGISFKIDENVNGSWVSRGTYTTDANGRIHIGSLRSGTQLRIRETVPSYYICLSQNPQIITLVPGTNTVTFENKPYADLKIVKTSTDGNVSGIEFKVERYDAGWSLMGTYTSNASGEIDIRNLDVGQQIRITEIVPENYICTSQNPQVITLVRGLNSVSFSNQPVVTLELIKTADDGNVEGIEFILAKRNFAGIFITQGTYVTDAEGKIYVSDLEQGATYRITETVPEGYYCDNPIQTFTAQLGTNTVTFENHPIVTLRIVKTSTDGAVDGISFTVERHEGAASGNTHSNKDRWITIGTYVTADGGIILVDEQGLLHVGDELRITETVPENYICLSENPQRITLVSGENTVQFENKPGVSLDILKTSDDGNIAGITFTLDKKTGRDDYSYVGEYVTGRNGQIHIEDLEVGEIYRITETLPYGYANEHISQEITIHLGTNSVTFVNRLILGSIKIVKVDEGTRTPLEGAGFRLYDERGEEIGKGLTDENGELIFEDLRVGSYTVKEYKAPEGFELDETEIPLELTPDAPDIEIERENKIVPGLIRVLKKNDQGQAMRRVIFLLEYSLDDTNTWQPVQYRSPESPVQAGYCTNEGLENGKLPTGPDGTVEFSGLAINNQLHTIKYRLTEVETQSGYELLAEPVFEGFLTGEQTEVAYEVVNRHVFEMPLTGGGGFTWTAIGSVLAVLLALGILLLLPKKRKNNM